MATSIGASTQAAQSIMKQDYKAGEMDLQAALALAVKVLAKTCDATALTPDKRTRCASRDMPHAMRSPRRAAPEARWVEYWSATSESGVAPLGSCGPGCALRARQQPTAHRAASP